MVYRRAERGVIWAQPYPRDTESMSEITQSVGIRACLHVETKLGDRFAFAHRLGAP